MMHIKKLLDNSFYAPLRSKIEAMRESETEALNKAHSKQFNILMNCQHNKYTNQLKQLEIGAW